MHQGKWPEKKKEEEAKEKGTPKHQPALPREAHYVNANWKGLELLEFIHYEFMA